MFYKSPPAPPYTTCGIPYLANRSVEWLSPDGEEQYNKHLSDSHFKELLIKNNWVDSKFTYDFNSFGFRSPEPDPVDNGKESILFLGCSHTFGVGLPLENTYPYIVSKDLNIDYWNMSVPGSSLDTAFRLASYWLNILKPTYIFLGRPDETRIEMHSTESNHCWHWNVSNEKIVPELYMEDIDKDAVIRWYENYYIHSKNQYKFNALKNIAGIKHYAQMSGSIFIEFDPVNILKPYSSNQDLARDCWHAGVNSNIILADVVKFLISEQNS